MTRKDKGVMQFYTLIGIGIACFICDNWTAGVVAWSAAGIISTIVDVSKDIKNILCAMDIFMDTK